MSCWFSCAPKNRVGIPVVSETKASWPGFLNCILLKRTTFFKNLVSLSYSVLSSLFD